MTILLTTHLHGEAELLCDRVGIIDAGKIVALDTPKNLKDALGGDRIMIQSKNPDISALKKMPCTKSLEHKNGTLNLIVKEGGCNLKKILDKAGDVTNVEINPTTLNDVFIHYTGKEIREAEAEGGFWNRMMNAKK